MLEGTVLGDFTERSKLQCRSLYVWLTRKPASPAIKFLKVFGFCPRPDAATDTKAGDIAGIKQTLLELGTHYKDSVTVYSQALDLYQKTLLCLELDMHIDIAATENELRKLREKEESAFALFREACTLPKANGYATVSSKPTAYLPRQPLLKSRRDRIVEQIAERKQKLNQTINSISL